MLGCFEFIELNQVILLKGSGLCPTKGNTAPLNLIGFNYINLIYRGDSPGKRFLLLQEASSISGELLAADKKLPLGQNTFLLLARSFFYDKRASCS